MQKPSEPANHCQAQTERLEARWREIQAKIESASPHLASQGTIVAKSNRGRKEWVLRYRLIDGQRRQLKTMYICADGEIELLKRSKKLLKSIREPARWEQEVAAYARCAGIARSLVKRMTGR